MGQVRALKLHLENSYNTRLTSKHPIMPWMVKHAAYLLNRYAIHADGNTGYYRRWNKEHQKKRCSPRTRMLTRMLMVQMSKHMDMQSRRTLFCNSLFEQSCTYFPCYQTAVWSGKCRVWSVECKVRSVECKVWSGECRVCKV